MCGFCVWCNSFHYFAIFATFPVLYWMPSVAYIDRIFKLSPNMPLTYNDIGQVSTIHTMFVNWPMTHRLVNEGWVWWCRPYAYLMCHDRKPLRAKNHLISMNTFCDRAYLCVLRIWRNSFHYFAIFCDVSSIVLDSLCSLSWPDFQAESEYATDA